MPNQEIQSLGENNMSMRALPLGMQRFNALLKSLVLFIAAMAVWPSLVHSSQSGTPLFGRDSNEQGAQLFSEHCAGCHQGTIPKAPSLEMMGYMLPKAVYRTISEGVMQSMASHLDDSQRALIAEYVSGGSLHDELSAMAPPACASDVGFDALVPRSSEGWGVSLQNTRFYSDQSAGIHPGNVGQLRLKWAFAFPNAVRARSQPAVAGGLVYVGSQEGVVYALSRDSGCVAWSYQARAEVRTGVVVAPWSPPASSDRVTSPQVYFADYLGYVYAVDALTGDLIWEAKADDHPSATITGTPALHDNVLYVPIASLEVAAAIRPDYPCCTFRGAVVALNALDGQVIWKTHSITESPEEVGRNSAGATRYAPSGAGIWNTPTIDIKRNRLYVGTGQNYSSPTSATSDSIIAMSLEGGAIEWVFQARPDAWNAACEMEDKSNCPQEAGVDSDLDFGAAVVLTTLSDGSDILLGGQKSGDVWALGPDDGSLKWRRKLGRGGMLGGVHFGMAANADSIFVAINDEDVHLSNAAHSSRWTGVQNPGVFALSLSTGEIRWAWDAEDICAGQSLCRRGYSAPLTATEQLVFAGSLDGRLRIHDAENGRKLWEFDTTQTVTTVSGEDAHGGAMAGGAGVVLDQGLMLVTSGYLLIHHMPGNVLLAFEVAPEESVRSEASAIHMGGFAASSEDLH